MVDSRSHIRGERLSVSLYQNLPQAESVHDTERPVNVKASIIHDLHPIGGRRPIPSLTIEHVWRPLCSYATVVDRVSCHAQRYVELCRHFGLLQGEVLIEVEILGYANP